MTKVHQLFSRLHKGDPKSKTLIKNIISSFGVKGLAFLVSLINIPIFMDYFENSSVLGVWFTLLSMLNWILTFDLGIGNGLRNYLVIALEKKDIIECRKLIASAYFSISTLVIVFSSIAYFTIPLLNWNSICNVKIEMISPDVFSFVIQLLAIGILIQFLLKVITSVLYAMQKPAIPNFLVLISNVLLLGSTFLLNTGDPQENLKRLSLAYILTANLPMLITTIFVFSSPLKSIGIHPGLISISHIKKIIGLGVSFLVLQKREKRKKKR